MSKSSFENRIIRAIKLDSNLYEEVEADKGALWQAMTVVVLSSIAAGIGLYKTGVSVELLQGLWHPSLVGMSGLISLIL